MIGINAQGTIGIGNHPVCFNYNFARHFCEAIGVDDVNAPLVYLDEVAEGKRSIAMLTIFVRCALNEGARMAKLDKSYTDDETGEIISESGYGVLSRLREILVSGIPEALITAATAAVPAKKKA